MTDKITHIVRGQLRQPPWPVSEVLQHFSLTASTLRAFEECEIVSADAELQYSQEARDQIHNIIMVAKIFDIGPKALRPLYSLFGDTVRRLSIKDTDLFADTGSDPSKPCPDDPALLAVTLKKIFNYLVHMDRLKVDRG